VTGSSIPPGMPFYSPALVARVAAVRSLLEYVETLPADATGSIEFERGSVLLEKGRYCWALCGQPRQRLTDILRHQTSPPLSREVIEAVVADARERGVPIGEAFVRSGLITDEQLAASLRQHIAESLCTLAVNATPSGWTHASAKGYSPRFTFSAVEVLVSVGALRAPETARQARAQLRAMLVPEAHGISFIRDPGSAAPLVLAEIRGDVFTTRQIAALSEWSMGLLDASATVSGGVSFATATWGSGPAILAWQNAEITHVAICEGPALALVVGRLSDQGRAHTVHAASTNGMERDTA
jgi:hypothetical protein